MIAISAPLLIFGIWVIVLGVVTFRSGERLSKVNFELYRRVFNRDPPSWVRSFLEKKAYNLAGGLLIALGLAALIDSL